MLHHTKVLSAASGWVLAVTLMIVATIDHTYILMAWSLLAALAAFVPTSLLITDYHRARVIAAMTEALRYERNRTDDLILAVATEFAAAELPRLEARRRI